MNATVKPAATILDLDSLLDESLDSVPDMPDFQNPPDGLYDLKSTKCAIEQYTTKAKDGKPATSGTRIRLTTSVLKTIEIKAGELPVPDGTLFSETFQGTEEGLGYFKARAIKCLNVADLKGVALRDILTEMSEVEYQAKITTKVSKTDTGTFENLNVRVIPPAAA
jgi:hypothetical protein